MQSQWLSWQQHEEVKLPEASESSEFSPAVSLPCPLPHSANMQIEVIIFLCGCCAWGNQPEGRGLVRCLGDGVYDAHMTGAGEIDSKHDSRLPAAAQLVTEGKQWETMLISERTTGIKIQQPYFDSFHLQECVATSNSVFWFFLFFRRKKYFHFKVSKKQQLRWVVVLFQIEQ